MSEVVDVVKAFDKADDLSQAQKEAVEALSALGEAKAELFQMEIADGINNAGESNKTIPVTTLIGSIKKVSAFSSTESDNIAKVVTDALKDFLHGTSDSVIDGVSGLLSGALTVFLGKAIAAEATTEEYYVGTEGISLVRIDTKAWYRNVSATSITKKMQKVTVVVGAKSIVDMQKIDLNTFLYFYQAQMDQSKMSTEQVLEEIENVKKIYNAFHEAGGKTLGRPQSSIEILPPAASHLRQQQATEMQAV